MDELDIPEFLLRPDTPELKEKRAKLVRRLNSQEVQPLPRIERVKTEYDAEGHPLPKNMDTTSRALLRSLEKTAAKKEKERKAEISRVLAANKAEQRAIKAAAKAAQKLNHEPK